MIDPKNVGWVLDLLHEAMEAERFGTVSIKLEKGQITKVEESFTKLPPRKA